ncbi:protein of unknown function [Candidatus Promineifilum breve]|uniref:Uncharacterized protein n=1 Tax=Candidatus Promineifilum breve TaxID=1806508 RepID=A0A170PI33_9CHLR|nr:protein of unknown function [Candidatus Promineifilum breve]
MRNRFSPAATVWMVSPVGDEVSGAGTAVASGAGGGVALATSRAGSVVGVGLATGATGSGVGLGKMIAWVGTPNSGGTGVFVAEGCWLPGAGNSHAARPNSSRTVVRNNKIFVRFTRPPEVWRWIAARPRRGRGVAAAGGLPGS